MPTSDPRPQDPSRPEPLPPELLELAGERVLPFIGAGLAVDAGVPGTKGLANLLRERAGLDEPLGDDLTAVTAALEAELTPAGAQQFLRETILELDVTATPTLTALAAGCDGGHILTTNYDDAIEHSAAKAGLTAHAYDITDARCLAPPPRGEVNVVHAHGLAAGQGRLILPGKATLALAEDPAWTTVVPALLAQRKVLYLGFRFGPAELPLQSMLARLSTHLDNAAEHVLLVDRDDAAERREHIQALESTGLITVLRYTDPTHRFVHRAARLLTPRAEPVGATLTEEVPPAPIGYRARARRASALSADPEELDRKALGADYDWGEPLDPPERLVSATRALLVAAPGMGKTELLRHVARTSGAPSVVVDLKTVAGHLDERSPPELAVARALAAGRAGSVGTPVPDRDALDESSFAFFLDGLDEVTAQRSAVTAAVVAAVRRWPQHRWVVASRPNADCRTLAEAEFRTFRIWPSRSWGREFLEGRGVPPDRLDELRDAGGFDDLMSIPLFAAAAAPRLLDPDAEIPTPLTLLVDVQRDAARREELRSAVGGDVFAWLQRLAVALELRGRTEASVAELAEVTGTGELEARDLREALIVGSLLAELPDVASFPRRTVQEALCADALLGGPDVAGATQQLMAAEVAGEQALRADTEFTLELTFENATHEQRRDLRAIDELRWARTVITSGDEADGDGALDVILRFHAERGLWLSSFGENQIRTPAGATAAIGRKWPRVIERRRDELLQATRSPAPVTRYNAALTLATRGQDDDVGWLAPLLQDPDERVAKGAVIAASEIGDVRLRPALWRTLDAETTTPDIRSLIVLALGELADGDRDELVRIAREADKRERTLRHLLPKLLAELRREDVLALLRTWPSHRHLWRYVIEVGFSPDTRDWDDDEVRSLVDVLVARDVSIAEIADIPALRALIAERGDVVAEVLRDWATTALARSSILVLVSLLPAGLVERERTGTLGRYIERIERGEAAASITPPSPPVDYVEHLGRQLDEGGITEATPRAELHWPRRLAERHRRRLRELSAAWWPDVRLADVRVHRGASEDEAAIAAVSAGAAGDAPLSRERWLEVFAATDLLDYVQDATLWLSRWYAASLEPDVIALIAKAPDARVLSHHIAALPSASRLGTVPETLLTRAVVDALIARLAELDDPAWWGNAMGLLVQAGHDRVLHELSALVTSGPRGEALDHDLAEAGDARAQIAVLQRMLEAARAGRSVGALHWRQPVTDPRVVELLAELFRILPKSQARTSVNDPYDSISSILANSRTERAVEIYDELIASDPSSRRLWYARDAVVRRLATERVLARLPVGLDAVARLALP